MKDYMYYLSLYSTIIDIEDGLLDEDEGLTSEDMDQIQIGIAELGKNERFTEEQKEIFKMCLITLSRFKDLQEFLQHVYLTDEAKAIYYSLP